MEHTRAIEQDSTRRSAAAVADALVLGNLRALDALCTSEVCLWTSLRERFGAHRGRESVTTALRRMLAMRPPSRIRVLQSGRDAAVLCGYAGDESLWTCELDLEDGLVDAFLVYLSPSSPVTAALAMHAFVVSLAPS